MPSNYLFIVEIAQRLGAFAFLLSTIFGCSHIFLTLFGVRNVFGTYRYLMVAFTVLGIFLAMLEFIFHPNLHFYNNGFAYFTLSKPFNLSKETLRVVLGFYTGVYSSTISLLGLQFIYRYRAIFCFGNLKLFSGWLILVWFSYCLFLGALWWAGEYFLLKLDDVSKNYFQEEMRLRYDAISDDLPLTIFLAYDPNDCSPRLKNIMYTLLMTTIMSVQYGTMVYCGYQLYTQMESKLQCLSNVKKHLHRQLFKTLVLQITAPTIFLFSPLLLVIYLPYLQTQLSFPAGATISAFSFFPALDSFIVMSVVTEYRLAGKRLFNSLLQNVRNFVVKRTVTASSTSIQK